MKKNFIEKANIQWHTYNFTAKIFISATLNAVNDIKLNCCTLNFLINQTRHYLKQKKNNQKLQTKNINNL